METIINYALAGIGIGMVILFIYFMTGSAIMSITEREDRWDNKQDALINVTLIVFSPAILCIGLALFPVIIIIAMIVMGIKKYVSLPDKPEKNN